MASSSPAILPISNPQTTTTTTAAPIATPAFRAFISNITDTVRHGFSQRRPWYELVDRSAFSKPDSLSDATHRIRKNYSYFRVNYLSCLAADSPLVILGRAFSDTETLGLLILSSVVVLFLTSVGSVLISALMVGIAIICAHGAFRAPEDLFLDEPEGAPAAGFLSFLSGPASNASTVAARV
ncbi:hypothetical protein RHGRI_010849 [Rhododendron griersonianum]|uniref:PRA1 family protein n=1 Tax=Rhododendron griersonianum TaxID=479676 RepID=A0AAV6KKJ4_9ERIC|nr:hypothetical protein RHGRI_010849 [Rhododendron griersonianum]